MKMQPKCNFAHVEVTKKMQPSAQPLELHLPQNTLMIFDKVQAENNNLGRGSTPKIFEYNLGCIIWTM